MPNHLLPDVQPSPGERYHHQKSALPSKPCTTCGRPMRWRRRWANNWDEVKYCSDACRLAKGHRA